MKGFYEKRTGSVQSVAADPETNGERFRICNLEGEVMFTSGHTLASTAWVIGDAAFIHDTVGFLRATTPRKPWRTVRGVPSGAVQLVELQEQGWSYLQPSLPRPYLGWDDRKVPVSLERRQ